MTSFQELSELDQLARQEAARYPKNRELLHRLDDTGGRHHVGIVGPRGVGKTIILKQLAERQENSFYLSLDAVGEIDLFNAARRLRETYGITLLLIDEIHFLANFEKHLKKIYDFLGLRIIFTSSVALSLFESAHDLSRRVQLITLPPFSYREYLFFRHNITLPQLSLEDIAEKKWTNDHMRHGFHFDEYLQGGLMPFSLEEADIFPLLNNIIQKIIYRDIPSVHKVQARELPLLEKTLSFVGKSEVDGINYTSVSKNIGITKYKAEAYLVMLEKAFLLNLIFPAGTNVLREPKVLMNVPYRLLYRELDQAVGGLREDYFCEMLRMAQIPFDYLKTKRGAKTPDFFIPDDRDGYIIEIGGKGKGRSQFKGIEAEKKIIFSHSDDMSGIKRPLFLLGYMT